MNEMIFVLGDVRLKLDADVIAELISYIQESPSTPEAGGVLLGSQILGSRDSVVYEITSPFESDRRARASFQRLDPGHQRRVDEVWHSSNGTIGYLGEWHTHAEHTPVPSCVDIDDWKRRLQVDMVDAVEVFFIIVGVGEIAVWRGDRVGKQLDKMQAVPSAYLGVGRNGDCDCADDFTCAEHGGSHVLRDHK